MIFLVPPLKNVGGREKKRGERKGRKPMKLNRGKGPAVFHFTKKGEAPKRGKKEKKRGKRGGEVQGGEGTFNKLFFCHIHGKLAPKKGRGKKRVEK